LPLARGNRSLAARHPGIGRATLSRWIARHKIDDDVPSNSSA
jgi:transcriptional regulator of acetoin/glycerol metabolism